MKDFAIMGLTIIATWSIIKLWGKTKKIMVSSIKYRQSTVYSMVKPIIPKELFHKRSIERQSDKHKDKTSFKVMFIRLSLNTTFMK